MLILLVIGLVALGVMVTRVDHELTDLTHTLLKISEDVRATKPSGGTKADPDTLVMKGDSAQVVSVEAIKVGETTYTFRQRCNGKIDVAPNQTIPFCIGDNQLTVTAGDEKPVVLDNTSDVTAQAAPVLRPLHFVPSSSGKGTLLVSYGPDTCVTTDDCGGDFEPNHVTHAYALGTAEAKLRPLSHYPVTGKGVWNPSGTKAVFIPETCGGASCVESTLIGYDLAADVAQPATTQKAAGSMTEAKDSAGKRLAQWVTVTWKSETEFTATYTDSKGKSLTVEGKF